MLLVSLALPLLLLFSSSLRLKWLYKFVHYYCTNYCAYCQIQKYASTGRIECVQESANTKVFVSLTVEYNIILSQWRIVGT